MAALREIAGPAGRLEVLLDKRGRGTPPAAVVFGHPHPLHGGTMHTKMVYRSAKALAALGCAVLRFNFRGVGRSEGQFANGVGEIDDLRAAVDFMSSKYPKVPMWTAGMSFGAYVSLAAGAADDRVGALLGLAPPLHLYDFSAVRESAKAKYFVQGERDEICPLAAMQTFFESLTEPKRLMVVPGANHLFVNRLDEAVDAVRTVFEDWRSSHA